MGWYLRKSFGFGPFRLNLSKSGIGYSIGVRGARIGVGSRGPYVRAGLGGIYYQKHLSPTSVRPRASTPPPNTPAIPPVTTSATPIPTADAATLRDSSADELLQDIEEKNRRIRIAPLAGAIFLVTFLVLASNSPRPWLLLSTVIIAVVGFILLAQLDHLRRSVRLNYELDDSARKEYLSFLHALQTFANSARIWRVPSEERNIDPKYHAGANTQVDRQPVQLVQQAPPYIQTDIAVCRLPIGNQDLYFFPDRILVYQGSRIGAVPYESVTIGSVETRFAEEEAVPADSVVIGTTWRYTNRNGGPDRRFSNNRQIPWVRYASLHIASSSGMNLLMLVSCPEKAVTFKLGFEAYAKARRPLAATETSG